MMLNNPDSPRSTWDLYRASFIRTQIIVLVLCIVVYMSLRPAPIWMPIIFVVLHLFAFLGIKFGVRQAKRAATKDKQI